MSPLRFNRVMQAQLSALRRAELIDAVTHKVLVDRYPVTGRHWLVLGRWLLIFGALSVAAGVSILVRTFFEPTLEKAAIALVVAVLLAFLGAYPLSRRGLLWTSRSLELFGGLLLVGLSFVLGSLFSTGSGNWPMLLLIDLCLLLPLAYVRCNPLLLVLSAVVFFVWFGGVTGYESGWGAYWFGMNYPLRFLLAGTFIASVGVLHRLVESGALLAWRGFFKIWLSAGIFFAEMALWLMSLFGNFNLIEGPYLESDQELWLFNLLWAGGNALLMYLGARYGLRMLRGYAVSFLLIQGYTLFFWHIAGQFGPILSSFVAGSVTLGLVFLFERKCSALTPGPG